MASTIKKTAQNCRVLRADSKRTMEAKRKWEEAIKKLDDTGNIFASATKRVDALAREVEKCVYHVAQGNQDRLENEHRDSNGKGNMNECRDTINRPEEQMLERVIVKPKFQRRYSGRIPKRLVGKRSKKSPSLELQVEK